jgi:hypothetical protein
MGAFAFGRSGGVIRQCGGTLTSPLERMRMTYNPTFFSGSPKATAISAPGMSGLAHLRPNNVKSGLLRLRSRVDRSKNWPGQPAQPQPAEVEVSLQMRETPEQLLKRLSSGIHRRRLYKRRHNPCIQ